MAWPLTGIVEVDETYVGGLSKNMHKSVRAEKITGGGMVDKTPVIGALNRGEGPCGSYR
ncbi:MAG: transposase [Verrucomicrobia bacterium]|nr:transposase [Verrucomicrobiota bacterium]